MVDWEVKYEHGILQFFGKQIIVDGFRYTNQSDIDMPQKEEEEIKCEVGAEGKDDNGNQDEET